MTKSTNEILEKIRELNPGLCFTSVCRVSDKNPNGVRKNYKKAHLEHLLLAIDKVSDKLAILKSGSNNNILIGTSDTILSEVPLYDLNLTVEQNLTENEDLRKLLTELLF